MNWLIIIVLFIQAFFYWLLKPFILLSTPVFEARAIWLVVLGLFFWVFSGKSNQDAIDEDHN